EQGPAPWKGNGDVGQLDHAHANAAAYEGNGPPVALRNGRRVRCPLRGRGWAWRYGYERPLGSSSRPSISRPPVDSDPACRSRRNDRSLWRRRPSAPSRLRSAACCSSRWYPRHPTPRSTRCCRSGWWQPTPCAGWRETPSVYGPLFTWMSALMTRIVKKPTEVVTSF